MKEILDFLRRLAADNSREWLAAHDSEYRRVTVLKEWAAQQLIETISRIDREAARLTPKGCTYRLMRDTRFSADKTPYKTHIGIFICPPYGKKSLLSGYYLHLEPGNSFICGGNYGLPTKHLYAIRNDIRDNIEEYIEIVESPEFKKYFPTVGSDFLKTAPKGFDRDWEYIDYVRPREFGCIMPLEDSYFDDPLAIETLLPVLTQIKRLNDFINFTLTESGLPLLREGR